MAWNAIGYELTDDYHERSRVQGIAGMFLASRGAAIPAVSGASLVCLAALGAIAARAGGASAWVGAARVLLWGVLAMAATAGVGALFGTNPA
jgi:VIT1/CCC1 family predicted Fe2+/Mn2+ transporter